MKDKRVYPIYLKGLGDFLAAARVHKGLIPAHAAALARRRKLPGLSHNILLRLENGWTKCPDPDTLRTLAELYGLSYLDVVVRMVEERYEIRFSPKFDGPLERAKLDSELEDLRRRLIDAEVERDEYLRQLDTVRRDVGIPDKKRQRGSEKRA